MIRIAMHLLNTILLVLIMILVLTSKIEANEVDGSMYNM